MITCKEDLHNTWIKNDKGELRDLYISIAASFGIKNETCMGGLKFIGIFSEWGGCGFVGNTSELLFDQESRKQLTIKDLKKEKPNPTKFVKVEESIFDLKGEFERGELYSSDCEGHYTQLKCEKKFYLAAYKDSIYRKVEIDWRDEVYAWNSSNRIGVYNPLDFKVGLLIDNCNDKFIEMCHLVASLTEKPTNG